MPSWLKSNFAHVNNAHTKINLLLDTSKGQLTYIYFLRAKVDALQPYLPFFVSFARYAIYRNDCILKRQVICTIEHTYEYARPYAGGV